MQFYKILWKDTGHFRPNNRTFRTFQNPDSQTRGSGYNSNTKPNTAIKYLKNRFQKCPKNHRKKGDNKIRLVVQQYGLGSAGYIDYDKLTIDFDALIDKDEFTKEFLGYTNKYKNLLLSKIKEYEIENNIKFNNPQKIPYIEEWLK